MATKLESLCAQLGVRVVSKFVGEGPVDGVNPWQARKWRVTLQYGRKRYTTDYFQGTAHTSEPTAADLVACLFSDAQTIENTCSFDEWCGDFGYDTDSRKAMATYRKCSLLAPRLRAMFGDTYDMIAQAAGEY